MDSPVAEVLGSIPLVPEESTSYTFGAVWQPWDNTSITFDYYDISIEDRLALLGPNTITQDNVDDLIAEGVPNAQLLLGSLASYFANSFDSDVSGIDLAWTSTFDVGNGSLLFDLRHNYNKQEISNVADNTINDSRVYDLENQVPEHRTTVTLDWQSGGIFGGYVRLNNYGDWSSTGGLFSPGDASDVTEYSGALLVDLEARATFADWITVAIGAENVFDEVPDAEGDFILGLLGVQNSLTSPYGVNGGFYYARAVLTF